MLVNRAFERYIKIHQKFAREDSKMKNTILSVFAHACFICLMGVAATAGTVDWRTVTPLPDEIKIEPPGPGVSPSIAKLSGAWQGALAC